MIGVMGNFYLADSGFNPSVKLGSDVGVLPRRDWSKVPDIKDTPLKILFSPISTRTRLFRVKIFII